MLGSALSSRGIRIFFGVWLAAFVLPAALLFGDSAVGDFSPTSNPNGVWSYGYSTTLSGAFVLYNINTSPTFPGTQQWRSSVDPYLAVCRNPTGSTLTALTASIPPNMLLVHPGPSGQYSKVRWTAPAAGTYQIAGSFQGLDSSGPTTTDVHIRLNSSTSLFTTTINSFNVPQSFTVTRTVSAGDTIDFAVGFGSNGNYLFDSTGLAATITLAGTPSCTYSIAPTSQSFPANGGTGSVSVTAPTGCAWTAASNAVFITITSGSSGNGNGKVDYTVAANTGGSRTGTLTIAGQTYTVVQAGSVAELIVRPQTLSFSGVVGGGSDRQALQIGTSSGTVTWSATVTLLNGIGWLGAFPLNGTATANLPSRLVLGVDFGAFATAGLYQALVTVRDSGSGASVIVPVTVAVRSSQTALRLSHEAFVFRALQGGSAPQPQTLRIFNFGQGTLSWSISLSSIPPAPWLSLSALAGSAGATFAQASPVTISVNPAGLAAGVYQALVPVSAPGAANDPQLVLVTLLVVPVGTFNIVGEPTPTPPSPDMSPNGLLFVAGQGGAAPAAQSIRVVNTGGSSLTFQLQPSTVSGGNWLAVSPPTGSTLSGSVAAQASVNPAGLAAGVYRGKITGTFSSGAPQEVEVAFVVASGTVSPLRELPRPAACAPQAMELVSTTIGNGTVLPVSFPRILQALVVDTCGEAVEDATVLAGVQGLSISLQSLGSGLYSGNWVPERESSSVVISFVALHPSYLTVQRSVTVSAAAAAGGVSLPVLAADGVVEGAGFTPQRPLAPGGIISIFGSRFAASNTFASRRPLERELGGVSVRIGSENAPLYFAGPGQINAQMPFSARPGDSVSIVVNAGGRLTAPQSYQVAPAQPGVFVGGSLAAVLDGQSRAVTAANPARIGDTLQIFTTGLGITDPPAQTGAGGPSFSTVLLPVTVTIGTVETPVVYQGLAPGFVGLYQVNVVLPAAVAPGDAVPLVIRQNGISSNPNLPANIPVRPR